MIRVVVVEDEMLVRIGMKMCISEYDPKLTVEEDFASGEEALEYFRYHTADVLVTDIRLGGMTGLELIRQLKSSHAQMERMVTIILSCYEDFSYAKEAIALGVNSYVLKHEIGEEELPQLILEQYQRKKSKAVPGFLGYMEEAQQTVREGFGEAFCMAAFVLRREGERYRTKWQEISVEILLEVLQKHLKDEGLGECFTYHGQEVCAMLRFARKEELSGSRERIQRFFGEAVSSVTNYFNRNLYMAVSRPYDDLKETKAVYQETLEWLDQSFYYEKPFCLWVEDIPKSRDSQPELRLLREEIFREGWYQNMCHETGLFLQRCCSASVPVKEVKFKIIKLLSELELYLEQNCGGLTYGDIFGEANYLDYRQVEEFDSAQQLQEALLEVYRVTVLDVESRSDSFLGIEQYIRENYARQITLADMAQQFHMNPVYFCQYFKKKKGIPYVQYLNQIRIEEAKKLLQLGELSIDQIAEKTGIGNANYFGRLFKKLTGMTAGEYRKRNADLNHAKNLNNMKKS